MPSVGPAVPVDRPAERDANRRSSLHQAAEATRRAIVNYVARLKLTVTVRTKRSGCPFRSSGE